MKIPEAYPVYIEDVFMTKTMRFGFAAFRSKNKMPEGGLEPPRVLKPTRF